MARGSGAYEVRDPVWKLPAIVCACLAIAGVAACKKEAASSVTAHLPEVKVVTVAAQTVADEPEFLGKLLSIIQLYKALGGGWGHESDAKK